MSDANMIKIVERENLTENAHKYLQTGGVGLLAELRSQVEAYMGQRELRLSKLRTLLNGNGTLDEMMKMMKMLGSAEKCFLFGCYLLAKNADEKWDADQILDAIAYNCKGCVAWLNEDEKDFLGFVALKQADYLSCEQLLRLITVIDSYYIKVDILNRLNESQEPPVLAKVRRDLLGETSTVNKYSGEKYTRVFRSKSAEEAFAAFEDYLFSSAVEDIGMDMILSNPRTEDLKTLFSSIEKLNLTDPEEICSILKEFQVWKSGDPLPEGLEETDELRESLEKNDFALSTEDVEALFLSYVEYASTPVENWFDFIWKKLGAMDGPNWKPEDLNQIAMRWYAIDEGADQKNAKIDHFLVLLLRAALLKGTPEQIKKIMKFLSPVTLAKHVECLQKIDAYQLFQIMTDMKCGPFAVQKAISGLNLGGLSFDKLTNLLPYMLDDNKLPNLWLKEARKHD